MARFFGGGGEFASKGERETIPDSFQSSGSLSYEMGYGPKYSSNILTDSTAKNVERKLYNQILFEITEALGVLQRQGMWGWISTIEYTRGMQVLHDNDAWLCVNTNTNSAPYAGNGNWLRMVELFQQVGVTNTYQVGDGTRLTAPLKGSSIFVSGYWKTNEIRIDRDAKFNVAINNNWKNMEKTGDRGGSKGHSYYSNNYFAFSHIFNVDFNKGDNILVNVTQTDVPEYELFLTFLG